MATKARTAALKAAKAYDGVAVFNAIRASSPTLQSRYAEATSETLKTIGYNLSRDEIDMKLAYLNGLLRMVSAVFVADNNITNPLADLIVGGEYYAWGDLIENIKVKVAKGVSPKYLTENLGTGKSVDPFVQNMPELVTEFWQSNLPLQYLLTISEWQIARSFENAEGMGKLLAELLKSIENGVNIDLFEGGKSIMNAYINDTKHTLSAGQTITVPDVIDEASGKKFVLSIKNVISAMQFPTGAFNPAGIEQQALSDILTLYVRPDVTNVLSTEVWASAFNRDDLDLTPVDGNGRMRVKSVNDFGGLFAIKTGDETHTPLTPKYNELGMQIGYTDANGNDVAPAEITMVDPNEDVVGIIAAPKAFFLALRRQNYAPIYNPRGEYTNYWYNMEYWAGYSNFANVVIIKKASA